MSIDPLIQQLHERLPEIEWKLNQLDANRLITALPKGLFQCKPLTTQGCVDEIKTNLQALAQQDTDVTIRYLCLQIEKKINTLVRICQQSLDRKSSNESVLKGVEAIRTRQQWLKDLQAEVDALTKQQQALSKNTQSLLLLKKELGEVTRRLTLAQEKLNAASI